MSEFVPEGWKRIQLNDFVLKFQNGYAFSAKGYVSDGIPIVSMGSIQLDGRFKKNNLKLKYWPETELLDLERYLVEGGDLIMAMTDVTPTMELIGRACIVESKKKYFLNQRVGLVSVDESIACKSYIAYCSNFDEWRTYCIGSSGLGAQANLGTAQILGGYLTLPPLQEQQKIAAILTSVDEVIEKTQAQINKLKDLKTGMMQELLTRGIGVDGKPHTEFKDSPVGRIPKGWEVDKLSSIINVIESGWSPQCESEAAQIGEWCVLKTTAVSWSGFNYSANKKLPTSLEPRINIQVNAEDILITRAGPADRVGVVVYVNLVPKKVMLSDKIIRLRVNNTCNAEFISLWLSSTFAQHFMSSRVSGLASSQTNISQAILALIPCIIPSLVEQEMIASSIRSINERIDIVNAKFSTTKSLKKALMQDLLTGKVRVKVDTE